MNSISWFIDQLPSRYSSILNRGIITSRATSINATWIQSNLTIPAILENDGSSIKCRAVACVHCISETAVFRVQGPPLPPVNLTVEVSGDHLTLQWNPPSDTILTNDSIVSMYTVYVNTSRTGTQTQSNTTTTQYSIENPCSDVQLKVTAWNAVGEGTATTTYWIYRENLTGEKLLQYKFHCSSSQFFVHIQCIII